LDRQRGELGDNLSWRRRLGESLQRLVASVRWLACNQAAQFLDFVLLSDALGDAMKVLELIVRILKNWLGNGASLSRSRALLGRGLVLQRRRALRR
jgi:hypothetical protein